MIKVVKFFLSDISKASRNKREISTLVEMGCEVVALCPGDKTETEMSQNGYLINHVKKLHVTLKQPKLIRIIKIVLYWLKLARILKSLNPDCISCHDLTALFIGWLSTWFIPIGKRPILVYDSHEFEIGRNTGGRRGKFALWFISKMEKFLIGKSAFSIMVSESIANEVQKIYNLKTKPVVVRNVSNYWNIDLSVCLEKRKYLCRTLNVSHDTFLIMHHGGVGSGRGIEKVICAASKIDNAVVIILGYGEKKYLDKLKALTEAENVSHKVLFHKAVPIDILWQYVGAVDIGILPIQNICKSYYLTIPNKLFENIQSETPVIGNNFPETKKIIEGYNIGICCDPDNVDEIVTAIETLRNNKKLYKKFKENLKEAKKELCWENEKKVLIDAYLKVFSVINNRIKV